ncbi:unnamed protein product [Symbiodinium sp. CCMP2592]|nr:unnamed protein product [Symbiodinium sp. CCMP2592]
MARELQAELSPMAEWAQSGSKASVDALMNSWCTRLESLGSLSLGQAMQMKQTIQDLSFESTLSERLLEKVEAKVLATATAATPPPDTTYTPHKRKEESKPQTLLKPENFITVTEWSMLEKSPAPARLEILLKRYLQLGLRNLTEQTVKKGLAFLLALAAGELSQMPTYEEIYEEVQVFKRSWESVKTDAEPTEVGLLTYPDDPSSLPKALFDRAYKAEDPPMGKDVRAGIWLAHIPMRSTSKLLQKNKKQRLPRPDGQAAVSEQHANEFQSRMEQCFGRLERMLDQGCGQNAIQDGGRRELQLAAGARGELSSSSAGVGFALGNPAQPVSAATQQTSPGRQSALQLALPPAEEPEATESLPAENDLEDEALFKKLKDRKAGILKKPAAAAAASSHGKRKFQIVWEDGCIQKNYASRMYKRAGTWAKHQGFSEQQVVECQREAHREAILLWKKKNGPCTECGAPSCCRVKNAHQNHWCAKCTIKWYNERDVRRSNYRRAWREYEYMNIVESGDEHALPTVPEQSSPEYEGDHHGEEEEHAEEEHAEEDECLVSLPIALSCVVVLLPVIPWAFMEQSGIAPASVLWPTFGAFAFVFFYFSIVTFRAYFRSLRELETMRHQFTVKDTLCWCCSIDHKAPNGSEMACDRQIVFQCITTWFGSLSNFDTQVREQVARCLDEQLTREVFTYRQCAASAMPVLWHFLDQAATVAYYHPDLAERSRSFYAVLRELVRGLGWSCGVFPTLFFVAVRLAEIVPSRCGSRLAEIFINCAIIGAVFLLMVGALNFERYCWDLPIYEMDNYGPYELFPGSAVFSLSTVSLAVLLFSCRRFVVFLHQLQKPSNADVKENGHELNGHELGAHGTIIEL